MNDRKKIVLIYPDTHNSRANLLLPLSLIYIATPLRKTYDISIIDQRVDADWRNTLRNELRSGKLLCAGISSMTGPQIAGGIETASIIKEMQPSVPVVWGGVHASLLPEQTICSKLVDVVVIGDGEETFRELTEALRSGGDKKQVKGIMYKEGGAVIQTAPRGQYRLGAMGTPAYDLVNIERYKSTPAWTEQKSLPIITSRGCPYRCGYCYNTRFSNRQWTSLSAEETVSLILRLVETYRLTGVFLLDDNFFVNLKRIARICELLIKEGRPLSIYNANCRADAIVHMDDDYLRLLKKAGFDQIFVGVESGSAAVLKRIQKDITIDDVLSANARLKKAGIKPFFSFMAGFPNESTEEVKATLRLMRRLLRENPDAIVYKLQLFTPFPGTELYELSRGQGMQFPNDLEAWEHYHYDRLNYDKFHHRHRKFLEDFHYYTGFLDRKLSRDRARYLRIIASIYSRLLDLRLRHDLFFSPFELVPLRVGQQIRNRILHRC